MPVAFGVGGMVLHLGYTRVIKCNYKGLHQRMHRKSILLISYTYRRSYSGHVSDASGKIKEHIKQLWSEY